MFKLGICCYCLNVLPDNFPEWKSVSTQLSNPDPGGQMRVIQLPGPSLFLMTLTSLDTFTRMSSEGRHAAAGMPSSPSDCFCLFSAACTEASTQPLMMQKGVMWTPEPPGLRRAAKHKYGLEFKL